METSSSFPSSVCSRCVSNYSRLCTVKIGRLDDKYYYMCRHTRRCYVCGEGNRDTYTNHIYETHLWLHDGCENVLRCQEKGCTETAQTLNNQQQVRCHKHNRCIQASIIKLSGICGRVGTRYPPDYSGKSIDGVFNVRVHSAACDEHMFSLRGSNRPRCTKTRLINGMETRCSFIIDSHETETKTGLCTHHLKCYKREKKKMIDNLCASIKRLSVSERGVISTLPLEVFEQIFIYCDKEILKILRGVSHLLRSMVMAYNQTMFTRHCVVVDFKPVVMDYDSSMRGYTVVRDPMRGFLSTKSKRYGIHVEFDARILSRPVIEKSLFDVNNDSDSDSDSDGSF